MIFTDFYSFLEKTKFNPYLQQWQCRTTCKLVSKCWIRQVVKQSDFTIHLVMYILSSVTSCIHPHRVHDTFVQQHDRKFWKIVRSSPIIVRQSHNINSIVALLWVKVWHAQLCSTIICRVYVVAAVSLTYDNHATVIWWVGRQISYCGYQKNILSQTILISSHDRRMIVSQILYLKKGCTTLHVHLIVLR